MYTLGIDIGSTTSKCAVLKDGTELVGKSLQRGGLGTDGPAEALAALWRSCGLTRADMCRSVASRVAALARRAGVTERVCMSGGVAKNSAVRQAISEELGVPVSFDPLAQYFGAIGAGLWAYKEANR